MKKIFRIKKYNFENAPCLINGKSCVTIFQSNTLGLTWKHLATYLASFNREDFLKTQVKLMENAREEVKKLYKTENCYHKNTHKETVCHTGGEVGIGLICDNCGKLLRYD